MKLIIDIPDRTYNFIMELNQHTFGSKYAHKDIQADIVKAVKESKTYSEPSGDCISRTELKKCAIPCQIHNGALTDLCVPLYQIDNAPPVEPEWGKWIISEIQCPNCLGYFQTDCFSSEELKKCPNCGATLKGGEE